MALESLARAETQFKQYEGQQSSAHVEGWPCSFFCRTGAVRSVSCIDATTLVSDCILQHSIEFNLAYRWKCIENLHVLGHQTLLLARAVPQCPVQGSLYTFTMKCAKQRLHDPLI